MTHSSNTPHRAKKLILRVPGSTSNLGPGLDTLSLALGTYSRLTFSVVGEPDPTQPFVTFKGPITTRSLPADINSLIERVFRKLFKDDPDLVRHMRIQVDSEIPLGVGLGSSDAAIVASIWAAYHFRDIVPSPAELLAEAAQLEGHGESMAASLLGGFVVCMRSESGNRFMARQHSWPSKWKTLLVVPRHTAKTTEARAVLPMQVALDDAVTNVQRTAFLVSAVINSNDLALKEALVDRLHEPYRAEIAPLLGPVRELLSEEPVLGTVLSGAGPSILVIVLEKHKKQILDRLNDWASTQSEPPAILDIPVDMDGIKELGQPGRPASS